MDRTVLYHITLSLYYTTEEPGRHFEPHPHTAFGDFSIPILRSPPPPHPSAGSQARVPSESDHRYGVVQARATHSLSLSLLLSLSLPKARGRVAPGYAHPQHILPCAIGWLYFT